MTFDHFCILAIFVHLAYCCFERVPAVASLVISQQACFWLTTVHSAIEQFFGAVYAFLDDLQSRPRLYAPMQTEKDVGTGVFITTFCWYKGSAGRPSQTYRV